MASNSLDDNIYKIIIKTSKKNNKFSTVNIFPILKKKF
jgi:hypothetical protein